MQTKRRRPGQRRKEIAKKCINGSVLRVSRWVSRDKVLEYKRCLRSEAWDDDGGLRSACKLAIQTFPACGGGKDGSRVTAQGRASAVANSQDMSEISEKEVRDQQERGCEEVQREARRERRSGLTTRNNKLVLQRHDITSSEH